ncbi:unnamed protein product [Cuscuta campestris]|uniref:DUF1677 domain-containing protein n=1 Tax=Cuscuta campestris TaxID=132261 RepID=A0A484M9H6_9ASTE|nr:unnamed protein product [Cuscuta campestris]
MEKTTRERKQNPHCSRPPPEPLRRTISDAGPGLPQTLPAEAAPVAVEEAKCECCGHSEECTAEYVKRVREKCAGKLLCGLCSEAVEEETWKNGRRREAALQEHMNECLRFNRVDRVYPVLCQAEAMREVLKNSRGKALSPRGLKGCPKVGGFVRTSSCIPSFVCKDTKK